MRLLVTGGRTGYLGRHVVAVAAHHDVVAVGSADADVRDPAAVDALVERCRPDAVVHTAYVQADPEVTGTGAVHVARAAARVGARLVLVSSDVVFGGRPVPYDETATADPVSAYGGMVPRQYQSGELDRRGRITKRGPAILRKLLVQSAWAMLRYNPWARAVYARLSQGGKTRKKQAIVALARKLLVRLWAMLRDQTPWRGPPALSPAEPAAGATP